MQLECASAFKKIQIEVSLRFTLKMLSQENAETLMTKTLEVLNCTLENEPLKEAWCEVFILLVKVVPLEFVL